MACFLGLSAQDRTYRQSQSFRSNSDIKTLIIPFEDKMFLSDVNREIGKRTGLTSQEIKNTFREGLIQTIVSMGMEHGNYMDPFELEPEEFRDAIGGVYANLIYEYELTPPLEEVKDKSLLEKIKKEDPEQIERGTYLDQGEIRSWYDGQDRFMKAKLRDPSKVKELFTTYNLDVLLVITELDIKVMRDVNRDVGQTWDRRVKVHFTIFNEDGEAEFGSAAFNYYPGHEKDIYTIIRKSFDYPAAQIISKITPKFESQALKSDKNENSGQNSTKRKSGLKEFKESLFKSNQKE